MVSSLALHAEVEANEDSQVFLGDVLVDGLVLSVIAGDFKQIIECTKDGVVLVLIPITKRIGIRTTSPIYFLLDVGEGTIGANTVNSNTVLGIIDDLTFAVALDVAAPYADGTVG